MYMFYCVAHDERVSSLKCDWEFAKIYIHMSFHLTPIEKHCMVAKMLSFGNCHVLHELRSLSLSCVHMHIFAFAREQIEILSVAPHAMHFCRYTLGIWHWKIIYHECNCEYKKNSFHMTRIKWCCDQYCLVCIGTPQWSSIF